jgi:hypothetical protein
MSGILAVYSLVIAVLIAEDLAAPSAKSYSLFTFVESIESLPDTYLLTSNLEASCTLAAAYRWD